MIQNSNANLSIFILIIQINESKTLTKHMLCECKYKLNGKKRNSKQNWNSYKCQYDCNSPKKHHVCGIDHIWNPSTWT